jgi:hypothetical protein
MDIQITIQNGYGDLTLLGNDLVVVQGLENQPMLGMFGGDANYWANQLLLSEGNDMQFFSETEALLNKVPLNSAGRLDIEAAIKMDLQFLINNVPNTALNVQTKIVSDNRLEIKVNFGGVEFSLMWNPVNYSNSIGEITPPSSLLIWSDAVFPYGVSTFALTEGLSTVSFPCSALYSSPDVAIRVGYFNSVIVPANGMTGLFTYDGGAIYYNQGVGESWTILSAASVLDKLMKMTVKRITSGYPAEYDFTFSGVGGEMVVDWQDSSAAEYYKVTFSALTPTHNYGSGTTRVFSCFHNNTLITFIDINGGVDYKLKSIGGTIPYATTGFFVTNQTNMTVGDMPINTLSNLEILVTNGSDLVGYLPPLLSGNYPNIRVVNVVNNNLDPTQIDQLFNDLVANTPNSIIAAVGRTMTTNLQTPIAPPTIASLTARNLLIAAGWTIVTD